MNPNELLRDPFTGSLIINDSLSRYQDEVVSEIDMEMSKLPGWELNKDGSCWIFNGEITDSNKITWVCRYLSSRNGLIIQGNQQPQLAENYCMYSRVKELINSGRLA